MAVATRPVDRGLPVRAGLAVGPGLIDGQVEGAGGGGRCGGRQVERRTQRGGRRLLCGRTIGGGSTEVGADRCRRRVLPEVEGGGRGSGCGFVVSGSGLAVGLTGLRFDRFGGGLFLAIWAFGHALGGRLRLFVPVVIVIGADVIIARTGILNRRRLGRVRLVGFVDRLRRLVVNQHGIVNVGVVVGLSGLLGFCHDLGLLVHHAVGDSF